MFENGDGSADGEWPQAAEDAASGDGTAAEDGEGVAAVRELLGEIGAGIALLAECDSAVLLGELAGREPGPLRGALLDALDVGGLAKGELLDVLKARAGQAAHAEAGELAAMAAYAGRRRRDHGPGGGEDWDRPPAREQVSEWTSHEIGARLCLSRPSARNRMEHALTLTGRLPGTFAALRTGRIDGRRATVIAEATMTLDVQQSAAVEARVLPRAERQTASLLRASVRRAVLRTAPEAVRARRERAVAAREVRVSALEDGMAELCWTDSAERILAFSAALDALARLAKHGEHGDGRTIAQCRADVLTDLARRLLNLDGLPAEHGSRPQVSVVVPLGVLAGLTDEAAELVGYGPIPAELARAIAADATWRRLLTDPLSGAVLDVGRQRYRPPAALREHVLARDFYCQGLGCRVPARRCDLDHRVDWAHGGHTRASDLDPLCRTHHRLKHEGGWARERHPDGSTTWTAPTGHRYVRDPDWLPGAKPPDQHAFTAEHQQAIRDHARMLGIALPGGDAVCADAGGLSAGELAGSIRPPSDGEHPPRAESADESTDDDEPPPF